MIKSRASKIGDIVIIAVCCVLIFICLVPMLNVLARSLSSTEYLIRNEVLLWPKGFNLDAYTTVLKDAKYTHSLGFTAVLKRPKRRPNQTIVVRLCALLSCS